MKVQSSGVKIGSKNELALYTGVTPGAVHPHHWLTGDPRPLVNFGRMVNLVCICGRVAKSSFKLSALLLSAPERRD